MPVGPTHNAGLRIAATRRARRLTQSQLADAAHLSLSMLRKIEQGSRVPSTDTLDAIADALRTDPSRLLTGDAHHDNRVRSELPALSAVIATYDMPSDGPVRPTDELATQVRAAAQWRLGAQYLRIVQHLPSLLDDLARALSEASAAERPRIAELLVAAYRAADAVAYKYGARDLSARLIDLMRWAATHAENDLVHASVAYVRTETFFAARAHTSGLRHLEKAIDRAPAATDAQRTAARGALHMRAAVIAGRAGALDAADTHLAEARALGDSVTEAVYHGTAFGPDSVRIHAVAVAVSLGSDWVGRALDMGRSWMPPATMPAERRSGFYIDLARIQLWAGLMDDSFESLKTARRIAPQHTREHPWARQDTATLRRLKRADFASLTHFAEWIGAV
ncbi:helix-turn-helix transcriptional regulator [Streptomyces sp. ASQP_92]|uniref:helix-turn-helix domain-containing protein n=1 Tax=Streptomyces sp. ASQP_92 TaxID=2979116 RepID=UPI0021C16D60|nr:helix-turn-helix transcriptional regulator [Streptomyces sp. ASQP_92]MCT9091581.1 helix-turn-helix transcriptional regulator [Streptomyces sp. ASQP_92]